MTGVQKATITMIDTAIKRAIGSKGYGARELFYEAKGINDLARTLGLLNHSQYMEYNDKIVRNGINNPEFF